VLVLFGTSGRTEGYKDDHGVNTVMRRITTFRSTTDRIYDGGPIILLHYNIILQYHCVTIA
jgi:hypothetical protein